MNSLLSKHRPKEYEQEAWEKHWNNLAPTFQALADTLKEMKKTLEKVDPADFSIPNHYEKLVYNAGQVLVIDKILALLPENVDK